MRNLSLVLAGLAAACGGRARRAERTYYGQVQPILQSHCVFCHGVPSMLPQGVPNGLYLDTYAHVLRGSDYGPVVRPGDTTASLLVTMVKKRTMPPTNLHVPSLTAEQIETITRWVAAGAPAGKSP